MPEPLKIDIENNNPGVCILRLTGPLTLADLFEFQDAARAETHCSVLIDLTGVPYMDSAGLGAVLGVMASCNRTGRQFGITGLTDRVRTLLQLLHVDDLIPNFDSAQTFKKAMAASAF